MNLMRNERLLHVAMAALAEQENAAMRKVGLGKGVNVPKPHQRDLQGDVAKVLGDAAKPMTSAQIAARIGASVDQAQRALRRMTMNGRVEAQDHGATAYRTYRMTGADT